MAETPAITSSEAAAVASKACTQSGAVALLLCVALCLIIPYSRDHEEMLVAGQYVGARLALTEEVETLVDDPIWQRYQDSHAGLESASLSTLLKLCMPATVTPKPPPKPLPKPPTLNAPAPPTGLSACFVPMPEIGEIADLLKNLNDSRILTQTRMSSNFFNYSVSRWINKRNGILYTNSVQNICGPPAPWEKPNLGEESAYFIPSIEDRVLLECLTLRDIRLLANFEPPVTSVPPQLSELHEREIDISPESLPRQPYAAAIVAQILIFFLMVYFAAFAQESVADESFPSRGTLFSGFAGSRWTLSIFLITLFCPLVWSLIVSINFKRVLLWICTLLIYLATLRIFGVLLSRDYFKKLDPSDWDHFNSSQAGSKGF